MDEIGWIERARGGEDAARKTIVERASLRTARVILGDNATDRLAALKELARSREPSPEPAPNTPPVPTALGFLLAAIGRDGERPIREAMELAYRANTDRWNARERLAIEQAAAAFGAALGGELAVELVEWAYRAPGDHPAVLAGATAALRGLADTELEPLRWRTGFERYCAGGGELVERWCASPVAAPLVVRSLFDAHARERGSITTLLDSLWTGSTARATLAAAIAEATSQNRGMSGREAIAAWGWQRFCAHPGERVDLYAAFRPWRDHWIDLRNAMPGATRPAGADAIEHLRLWGGLDVEHLSATVEEAGRLARDRDWAELVDITFDLARAAPLAWRLHALAGACRVAHLVSHPMRGDTPTAGNEAAADRLIARAEALTAQLRGEGAVLDQIVANRVDDLAVDMRLIREARERRAERAAESDRRAEEQRRRHEEQEANRRQIEEAQRAAEAARREAEEARRRAEAQVAMYGAAQRPSVAADAIDDELFFSSLPAARTLGDYARLFRRLTQDPNAVQSLAADGVSMEMIGVINQTWSQLFAQRPDLALRFSTLISAPWG